MFVARGKTEGRCPREKVHRVGCAPPEIFVRGTLDIGAQRDNLKTRREQRAHGVESGGGRQCLSCREHT